jgi:hypothetical protein
MKPTYRSLLFPFCRNGGDRHGSAREGTALFTDAWQDRMNRTRTGQPRWVTPWLEQSSALISPLDHTDTYGYQDLQKRQALDSSTKN